MSKSKPCFEILEKKLLDGTLKLGMAQNHFSDLTFYFEIQFKNTINLIFLSFKMPSKSFLFKNFKTGLTF